MKIIIHRNGTRKTFDVEDVTIIYEAEHLPGEDEPGELHVKATPEGIVRDVWVSRETHLDHNLATHSMTADEMAAELVENYSD